MTDTTPIRQIPDDGTHQSVGALEHLDPAALDIGVNVRDQASLTPEFLASIAENGVLVPITAVRDAHQPTVVRVRNGQRRTLAARQLGLPTVPVYVVAAAATEAGDDTIERIVHQIVTNDHQQDLTDAQRARGIQQMIHAGLSVTKVAKKLSVAKNTVAAAQTAGTSAAAMQALGDGQLSLLEAAAITEFEDTPGAIDRLLHVAGTARFAHTVAQLRQERAYAEAHAQAAQSYRDRGFSVLDQRPPSWDPTCIGLHHLVGADGGPADEQVVIHPAHWAVLLYEDTAWRDVHTGELIDEDAIDWDTEDNPDAAPAEGRRHANTVTEAAVFNPEYFCLDYRTAALTPEPRFARYAGIADTAGEANDSDTSAPCAALNERLQNAEDDADTQRRERRKVLALNRLGDAATVVRREFVTKLVARKTPPKTAARFVADCLARDSYLLTSHNAATTTAELLGIDGPAALTSLIGDLPTTGDGRAQVLTLALVLGALESRTPKDAWRNATPHWSRHVGAAEYLRWLAEHNGYALSSIEEVITGAKTADEAYDTYLEEVRQG